MAKRAKRSKRADRGVPKLPSSLRPRIDLYFELSDAVLEQPEILRRLGHHGVDLLADTGRDVDLAELASHGLCKLVESFVIEKVTALLEDGRAARKGVPVGKRAKRKAAAPPVVVECRRPMILCFSGEVMEERETFRRFAHRVVDLVVDGGHHGWLGTYVPDVLRLIEQEPVYQTLTNFVQEAWAEAKEARRG